MVTRLGWVCRKMPVMGLSAEAAAKKQKKMEEKERKKQEKEKKEVAKKQKKVPPGLPVYLFACSYLQTPPPGPKAPKTRGSD